MGRYLPRWMQHAPPLKSPAGGPIRPRTALLINPFYAKDPCGSFGKHVLTPSLALTSIAAATPSHWEVAYWDENLLQGPPPADPVPELVGITVHLTFADRAYELARYYRDRGAKVVFGGLHVHACPEETKAHADTIAIGEGTRIWPRIVADLERGKLKAVYKGSYKEPFQSDPPPRRGLIPRESFLTTASLIATRGCHNRCGFCYLATEGMHMPYQLRGVEQIVEEIEDCGEPYVVFLDNNLGSRRDYLLRLCEALRPLEIIWSAAVTIDVTDDPTVIRAMALAGCSGVFVGFESLQMGNLSAAGKRTPNPHDFGRRVRMLHDFGIQVNGSFVFGFDGDTPAVFEDTLRWIEDNRLECATFHILTPYPGTPMFRRLEEEGRLLHRAWGLYDTAHVVFRPRRMSVEQLQQGYDTCYRRLFSDRSIWRRRPADWWAVPSYLAGSYLYKRSNRMWSLLIRKRLVHRIWRPLVELSRRRHLRFRKQLMAQGAPRWSLTSSPLAQDPSLQGPGCDLPSEPDATLHEWW